MSAGINKFIHNKYTKTKLNKQKHQVGEFAAAAISGPVLHFFLYKSLATLFEVILETNPPMDPTASYQENCNQVVETTKKGESKGGV